MKTLKEKIEGILDGIDLAEWGLDETVYIDGILEAVQQWGEGVIGEDEPEIKRSWFGITQSEAYYTAREKATTINNEKAEQRERMQKTLK